MPAERKARGADSAQVELRLAAALFLVALVSFVYFYGGWGANQEVNFALARAMVEAGTFQIDGFTPREGDISVGQGGHIYSNKAPGFSALLALPYAAWNLAHARGHLDLDDYWPVTRRVMTAAVSGVCGALIPALLFLFLRRRLEVSLAAAMMVAVSVAFGTIVFPYSTMLFAHVASALFLFLAFSLLRDRPLLAGAAAGMAGATFFLSGLAALVLVLLAWSYSQRKAMRFVAGGAPFAVALGLYQWICFGSPFVTPVERSGGFTDDRLLLGVFGASGFAANLARLLFSEYRGLFFSSPVLIFAIVGAVRMARQQRFRTELIAIGGIAAVFLASNASFNGWHGGAAFGPRYLLPLVPLLAIPMAFAAEKARALLLLAAVAGLTLNLAATAVDPMPLDGIERPLSGYILPKLLGGEVPKPTWSRLCLENAAGVCPPGRVALWQGARNAGERFFGAGAAVSVVPIVLWIAGGSWMLLGAARRKSASRVVTLRPVGYVVAGELRDPALRQVELLPQWIPSAPPLEKGDQVLVATARDEQRTATASGGDSLDVAVATVDSVSADRIVIRGLDLSEGAVVLDVRPLPRQRSES